VTPFAGVDTTLLLQRAMGVAELNQRLIANNIANVDTPNYNPTELDFQATLRDVIEGRGRLSLRKTLPRHLDATRERAEFKRLAILSKNDYNKVDLDEQMANLSANTGKYVVYASLLTKRFEQVKAMLNNIR
jgi:flagellar basal-body rod protein FlgB